MKSMQNKVLADKMQDTLLQAKLLLFRELPDYTEDVETEWDLFKSATSAAASCGCKHGGAKWVVRKELLGGTKKAKKLSVQRKLRLDLG